jgi:hypothetical protein
MTHLSPYSLWGNRGHAVVTMPPSRDDLLCVTTVCGRAAHVQPIDQYHAAVQVAHEFVARLKHPRPVTVKVLCLTLAEARSMGFLQDDQFEPEPREAHADARQFAIATLNGVLRDGTDPQARTDAFNLLQQIGVIQ